MPPSLSARLVTFLGILLSLLTLLEVNYPLLSPQAQLSWFAMFGMMLCFLTTPVTRGGEQNRAAKVFDFLLTFLTVLTFSFVFVQSEPFFQSWWLQGSSLGNRAGQETRLDFLVGTVGLLLVLETTRRTIGWALPILSLIFLGYACAGPYLPDLLFPHRGYSVGRIVSQTFLQAQGVFGVALQVMFTYVFSFIVLGAFLKATGATQFIIDFTRHFFRRSPGGAAKVAVLSSGLMGTLSGSAVANTATTGTFTIPAMCASGFKPHMAAAIEAAASSGGALVPPVMGAGAYMMLEIVTPPVTFLQIVKAALLPSILYYFSLFLIVHFYSKKHHALDPVTAAGRPAQSEGARRAFSMEGMIFAGALVTLIAFLVAGYSPFRAVTYSLGVILALSFLHSRTRLTARRLTETLAAASLDVVPLICASACVGIVIGVVTLTGVGSRIPSVLLPLAEGNLALALIVIMVATIILGMGLPSSVSYLLMATLVGPVLGQLGAIPLAAHLFIFYFAMMSMVTPPVALAAYTAASIAGTPIMQTSMAAFRVSLVGFTLPFMFVFRPELLMLKTTGDPPGLLEVLPALVIATLGILAFAAGLAGHLFAPLSGVLRLAAFLAAGLLLFPGPQLQFGASRIALHDVSGCLLLLLVALVNRRAATEASEN